MGSTTDLKVRPAYAPSTTPPTVTPAASHLNALLNKVPMLNPVAPTEAPATVALFDKDAIAIVFFATAQLRCALSFIFLREIL